MNLCMNFPWLEDNVRRSALGGSRCNEGCGRAGKGESIRRATGEPSAVLERKEPAGGAGSWGVPGYSRKDHLGYKVACRL